MSESFQPGHEHVESRDAIVTLSTPMLEQLDDRQRRILVNDLVELSQSGRDHHAVSEMLGERLTKVLPRDYAKVMAARDEALARQLDDDQTTQLMMEATHG